MSQAAFNFEAVGRSDPEPDQTPFSSEPPVEELCLYACPACGGRVWRISHYLSPLGNNWRHECEACGLTEAFGALRGPGTSQPIHYTPILPIEGNAS